MPRCSCHWRAACWRYTTDWARYKLLQLTDCPCAVGLKREWLIGQQLNKLKTKNGELPGENALHSFSLCLCRVYLLHMSGVSAGKAS